MMRVLGFGRNVGAAALAAALVAGAAGTSIAQGRGRSVMTTGTAPPGANAALPPPGAPISRGSNWGPSGYQSDTLYYPVIPVPPVRVETAPPPAPGAFYGGNASVPQAGWSDSDAARGYRRVGRGYVVPAYLRTAAYFVTDWRGFGLARPARGLTWMRYYDDALLIDAAGRVRDVRYDIDWERDGAMPQYAEGGFYQGNNYDSGFQPEAGAADSGAQVFRSGPNAPEVSVVRNPDGSTTVTVREEPRVTTTTTHYVPVGPEAPPPAPTYMAGSR
jgi:Ni/Co efflux regulator RcnB